jgi:hypothetical protein
MNLTPESNQVLYASDAGLSVVDQLTAAFKRNVAQGIVGRHETVDAVGAAAIEIAQNTAATAPIVHNSLHNIAPWYCNIAETAQNRTEVLFDAIGIKTPDVVEFAEAGIDFGRLGRAYDIMTVLNLKPELVMAPILPVRDWKNLFVICRGGKPIVTNGLIHRPLTVTQTMALNWESLQGNQHSTLVNEQLWQAMVMPGTATVPIPSVQHKGQTDTAGHMHKLVAEHREAYVPTLQQTSDYMHPTIATYLTLQAMRLQNDVSVLDDKSSTWLDGDYADVYFLAATKGTMDTQFGNANLHLTPQDEINDGTGIRLPVWGEAMPESSTP